MVLLENDLLHVKKRRLFVPENSRLRYELLHETHDRVRGTSRLGNDVYVVVMLTLLLVKHRDNIKSYVKTCIVCQQDKERRKKTSLLPCSP